MTFRVNKSILILMKADFSKIINDSIKITKNNKRLWVFGVVLATLGAGANFSSGGNFSDLAKEFQKEKQENADLTASVLPQVLGSMDDKVATTASSLQELVKTIPFSFYVVLIILILTSIVIFTAIALYGKAWAQSGLIHGINSDISGESLSLNQMSDKGKLNAIEVIKISILPGLAFVLLVIASTLVLIIPGMLLGEAGKILLVIMGIVWVIAAVIASIILGASINLGVLAINLESLKWKVGFDRGFRIFKKFFVDYFIMSIINCFAGCVFGVASMVGLLILGGIGVASVFGAIAFPPFVVVAGPIIFLALLALIMLMGLIGAISAVFTQSTWVLLYRQLTEENHEQQ